MDGETLNWAIFILRQADAPTAHLGDSHDRNAGWVGSLNFPEGSQTRQPARGGEASEIEDGPQVQSPRWRPKVSLFYAGQNLRRCFTHGGLTGLRRFHPVRLSRRGPDALPLRNTSRHTVPWTEKPTIACLSYVQENEIKDRGKLESADYVYSNCGFMGLCGRI